MLSPICRLVPWLLAILLVMTLFAMRGGADDSNDAVDPMRVLFERGGIEAAEWNRLRDHRPLQGDEFSTLFKVLFRLPSLSRESLEDWSHGEPEWVQFIESSRIHRGAVFELRGRIRDLELVQVTKESAHRWGFGRYFRATLEVGTSPVLVTVYARSVPDAWQAATSAEWTLDEQVSALAVCIKLGETVESGATPIFATSRIAWHASRVNSELGVHDTHVLLGKLGMDIGLFDAIEDKRPLGPEDRECFYQLLAAAGRLSADRLDLRAVDDVPLRNLLETNSVQSSRGKWVTLTGNVRRVVRIVVEAPDIRRRLGVQHYFELNVFVDESVRVKRSQEDPDPLIYPRYPVVFCARQLPVGMPTGEEVDETVRISGFFYKLYAYDTEFTSTRAEKIDQLSPLIVGLQPHWIKRFPRVKSNFGLYVAIVFVTALAGIWLLLWYFHRRDSEFRRTVLAPRFGETPGQPLNELNLDQSQSSEVPARKRK